MRDRGSGVKGEVRPARRGEPPVKDVDAVPDPTRTSEHFSPPPLGCLGPGSLAPLELGGRIVFPARQLAGSPRDARRH